MKKKTYTKILWIGGVLFSTGIALWLCSFPVVEPTKIIKVPSGFHVVYFYPEYWYASEEFVITNPPKDLHQLRELIDAYDKEHPMDIQAAQAAIVTDKKRPEHTEEKRMDQRIRYDRIFYPENAETPRHWNGIRKPYEEGDGMHYIHIGQISWVGNSEKKSFMCANYKERKTVRQIFFEADGKTREYVYSSEVDKKEKLLKNWY